MYIFIIRGYIMVINCTWETKCMKTNFKVNYAIKNKSIKMSKIIFSTIHIFDRFFLEISWHLFITLSIRNDEILYSIWLNLEGGLNLNFQSSIQTSFLLHNLVDISILYLNYMKVYSYMLQIFKIYNISILKCIIILI